MIHEMILDEIDNISLNEKCNHRHFQNLNEQMINSVKDFLYEHSTSTVQYDPFIPIKKEYQVKNVILDCTENDMEKPLEVIASKLGIEFTEEQENYLTYFKFTSCLRNNHLAIQLHIFNQDQLTEENNRKINTLFLFNSNTMIIKSYFEENRYIKNGKTLLTNKNLDDREDYWTITIRNSVLRKTREYFE